MTTAVLVTSLLGTIGYAVVTTRGQAEPQPLDGDLMAAPISQAPSIDWQARYVAEKRLSIKRLRGWRRALKQRNGLRRAIRARARSDVRNGLLCIHRYEGAWNDPGSPFWGGLQMDYSFQSHYGAPLLSTLGTADRWPVEAQLAVATIAYYAGRGFGPWPNTRKPCGL